MIRRLTGRNKLVWTDSEDQFLLPVPPFTRELVKERMRVDRGCQPFVVLAFDVPEEARRTLSAILQRRIRLTDTAGLLPDQRVGVILPHTPETGARKLLSNLIALLSDKEVHPQYSVYIYPFDAPLDEHEQDIRGEGDDPGCKCQRLPPSLNSPSVDNSASRMEPFFVRPMPRWKRLLDILGAVVGLFVLSPLMIAVAIGVKLTSPGPILYRQMRAGIGGKPFAILKFRTMLASADDLKSEVLHLNEQDGPAFKIKADPRVTGFGKALRSTSIDELPQLWNILRGQMTLVGPRPLPVEESAACHPWQLRRLDVTPGLTCIWQVQGRSQVAFNEWMRMDLRYIGNRTLWRDLLLLVRTAWVVIIRRGAH